MQHAAKAIVVGMVTALLWAAEPASAAENYSPRVGEVHPDFVLPRIDNRRPVALSELRGKKVLLIHFASW